MFKTFCFLQDNVFIISNPKSKYPVLQLDLRYDCKIFENTIKILPSMWLCDIPVGNHRRLISDLVVVIVSAACGGIAFACLGQPVCFIDSIFF